MSNIAIKVNDISMMFNKSSEKIDSLKEYMIKLVKRQLMFEEFWALQNISFEIKKGEAVGIVGLNGSGKSIKANKGRSRSSWNNSSINRIGGWI